MTPIQRTLLTLFLIVTVGVASANAQGTANAPATQHTIDFNTLDVWIGGANDAINGPQPFPIDLDASGGPWTKQIFSDPTSGYHGGEINFRETILNSGTEAWDEWHEINLQIGSHGAVWGIVSDIRINGLSIGYTATVNGSAFDLTGFTQLVLPGDVLEIDKAFIAATENAVGPGVLAYTIAQFPGRGIPEPASLLLLTVGCTLLPRRRVS